MRLDDWCEQARRDAARRGLPDLDPLLDMLFRATRALRAADWAREAPADPAEGAAGPGAADDKRPSAPPEGRR